MIENVIQIKRGITIKVDVSVFGILFFVVVKMVNIIKYYWRFSNQM